MKKFFKHKAYLYAIGVLAILAAIFYFGAENKMVGNIIVVVFVLAMSGYLISAIMDGDDDD